MKRRAIQMQGVIQVGANGSLVIGPDLVAKLGLPGSSHHLDWAIHDEILTLRSSRHRVAKLAGLFKPAPSETHKTKPSARAEPKPEAAAADGRALEGAVSP
jgi:hypothetical protein